MLLELALYMPLLLFVGEYRGVLLRFFVSLLACLQQRHDGLLYMGRDVSGLQLINQRAGRLSDIIKRQFLR